MSVYFLAIEQWFQNFAATAPLPWFVFIGSGLEEIFSIIPASLVMGVAGSAALLKGESIFYIVFLALLGNIARLGGAFLYYWLGDRLEDILVPYMKKFFGVGHKEIEGIGKRFKGHHLQDGTVLFLMRVTPFFPVTITSIACGVIKMNFKVYMTASFLGNFFKDFIFLFVGYIGLASLRHIWRPVLDYKIYVDASVTILIVALFIFLYLFRGQGKRLMRYCKKYVREWYAVKRKK